MGSKPRVSIGMPVYNEELHLEQVCNHCSPNHLRISSLLSLTTPRRIALVKFVSLTRPKTPACNTPG